MTAQPDSQPTRVSRGTIPFAANPAGQPPSVTEWANQLVWTKPMLTALRTGVRGGRWHALYDKVCSRHNLLQSADKVIGNGGAAGVDHQSTEEFSEDWRREILKLEEALRSNTYDPQAIRRTLIPKPGSLEKRPLGIPTVRDRVVQTALLNVLEPIFDVRFYEHSYGFRHGRGCHHALERVEAELQSGKVFVVDADLKSYFDTIPHDRLMARIREHVSDSSVLGLVQKYLKAKILDELQEWTPETGTPQGAVISPLLANLYLNPLDHLLAGAGFSLVRYADDFVILCPSREDADRALALVQQWVADNGLTLHPTKTRIVDSRTEEFAFLGYTFKGRLRLPRKKSLDKLKDQVRLKTRRCNGHSLKSILQSLTPMLRGWFTYFRHAQPVLYRELDGWIRMRICSILRKRTGGRGRARGPDYKRWPKAFLCESGLYSLEEALTRFRQSLIGLHP
jgi:RNA-directed DNA polymerase